MKKVLSIITTIIFLWAILMAVDYFKGYSNEEKFLVNMSTEVTGEYTKYNGLGYTAIYYNYDRKNVHSGEVLKEFKILGLTVSKEIAVVKE